MSVETITLGCRLNYAESESRKLLADPDEALTIVNSCAVTAEAERQTRQVIRRARRDRPNARIVVTGCSAQLTPDVYKAMPEVDAVELRDFSAPLAIAAGYRGRVRSFVAVQTGCDHRCTFCTIWRARGPSRSLAFESVRDAIERELDAGACEIVLTGVDITSYEADGLTFGALCQRLLSQLPGLARLRLSSLDSIEVDPALLELIAGEERLMPHFHLSLQSGDDMVLKRMKRRHSRRDAVGLVERIKRLRSSATIGADLIAGFPTETEEMARSTDALLDDCDIVAAHVFPFSPRPDTAAARMPPVDPTMVKVRAARLRARAAERRSAWLDSLVGSSQPVLIENKERGHTNHFAPVAIASSTRGQQGMATITGHHDGQLTGVFQ